MQDVEALGRSRERDVERSQALRVLGHEQGRFDYDHRVELEAASRIEAENRQRGV